MRQSRALQTGIDDDGEGFGEVGSTVDIAVHHPCTRLDDRHLGMLPHIVDEAAAATGDDEVDEAACLQQMVGVGMARQQGRATGRQSVALQHVVDEADDGGAAVAGIAAALQDASAARLQAEREAVEAHVGACLEDDADDTEGHAHAAELESVGQHGMLQRAAERRGQCGHAAQVAGNVAQARCRELQAVVARVGLVHAAQVEGVGSQQVGRAFLGGIGQVAEDVAALGVGEPCYEAAGALRR